MIAKATACITQLNRYRSRVLVLIAAGSLLLLTASQFTSANTRATDTSAASATATAAAHPATTPADHAATAPAQVTAPGSTPIPVEIEKYIVPLPFDPPADRIKGHPLEGVIAAMRTGKSTETRPWVLPLLLKALAEPMRDAHITGYSSRDSDGGGPYTRWGTRTRWGICAADPAYWGPGSVIWLGDPVNQALVVEDTGSAIKGRDRFDVCCGDDPASSSRLGSRHANYVPLYIAPTRGNWGGKPDDWAPPLPAECRLAQKP